MQISTMSEESRRSFESLAGEYYDPLSHPTCGNFRAASRLALTEWLSETGGRNAFTEVGCGASLLAEVLVEKRQSLDSVTLTDVSPRMISYSKCYENMGAHLFVAPADHLPLPTASQQSVVACLGDPYNDLGFWNEAARILRADGQVFFTTPSFEWANRFRRSLPASLQTKAEFITSKGKRVWVPSIIVSEEKQRNLIESAGFRLLYLRHLSLRAVPPPVSSKLAFLRQGEEPVLTVYLAKRVEGKTG
jgi:SAM-dependent methyltransferase